jgi:hypothetical protein
MHKEDVMSRNQPMSRSKRYALWATLALPLAMVLLVAAISMWNGDVVLAEKPQATGTIGGIIWSDTDADGNEDGGEAGIANVGITLTMGTDTWTTTSESDGAYQFMELISGTYTITLDIDTLPDGVRPTYDLDGIATPHNASLTLGNDESRLDVNFGYQESVVLTKRHWLQNRQPGYSQRYAIDVTNTASISLTDVIVIDELPEMFRFANTDLPGGMPTGGNYSAAEHEVKWELDTMEPGEHYELAIFGYINSTVSPGTELSNRVYVSSTEAITAQATDSFIVVAPQPTATSTATPSATPTSSATPSPTMTATETLSPTNTPTATATPLDELVMYGHVYDSEEGMTMPISAAHVSLISCMSMRFSTLSDAAGSYTLTVPMTYLNPCSYVTLEAAAEGYETLTLSTPVESLVLQPNMDFWLPPLDATPTATPGQPVIQLPLLFKN